MSIDNRIIVERTVTFSILDFPISFLLISARKRITNVKQVKGNPIPNIHIG